MVASRHTWDFVNDAVMHGDQTLPYSLKMILDINTL